MASSGVFSVFSSISLPVTPVSFPSPTSPPTPGATEGPTATATDTDVLRTVEEDWKFSQFARLPECDLCLSMASDTHYQCATPCNTLVKGPTRPFVRVKVHRRSPTRTPYSKEFRVLKPQTIYRFNSPFSSILLLLSSTAFAAHCYVGFLLGGDPPRRDCDGHERPAFELPGPDPRRRRVLDLEVMSSPLSWGWGQTYCRCLVVVLHCSRPFPRLCPTLYSARQS